MSTPDKNLISFTGDAAGTIWRNGNLLFPPFKEGQQRYIREHTEVPITAARPGISDSLKFSGARWLRVFCDEVHGGEEDCVDINNRCEHLFVIIGEATPWGKYVATIKGASRHIHLHIAELIGHGSEMDIDLGNRSEQASERTQDTHLNIFTNDDSPVRVRVINAWYPELLNSGPQRYDVSEWLRGMGRYVVAIIGFFTDLLEKLKRWRN